jgi:Ca-activated chloride channel family protein
MKVNTLFPSEAEDGQIKGGVILIKLKKLSSDGSLKLLVSYEDRNGGKDNDEAKVEIADAKQDFYQNNGIRKAILLSRYADLLKNWMIDERKAQEMGWKVVPSVTLANGIVIPVELGEWERQSLPLRVSESYQELFAEFRNRFQQDMRGIGDPTLEQDVSILEKLGSYQGQQEK